MLWHVLCLIGFVVTSLCASEIEYEGNYADIYDNEISQDEQEGEFMCLFVTLFSCLFEQDHCAKMSLYIFSLEIY